MANDLRRRSRVSRVERCCDMLKSFTDSGEMALMTDVIEVSSPMGEPSKVALAGSNTWAPGIADRMGLVVAGLVLIASDF